MNVRCISGWLHGPATEAYSPDGVRKITFTVTLRDDLGHEFPERVQVENPAIIRRIASRLAPGCTVNVQGKVRAWPNHGPGGALVGWDRWIVADEVEVTRTVASVEEVAA